MAANWKEKSNLTTSTMAHHQTTGNIGAVGAFRLRVWNVLKNVLSLLFDSLFNSIHRLITFMNTTRVLYNGAPLSSWSTRRLTSMRKKTLILDLDETLIHSKQADQYGRQLNRAADSSIVTQEFGGQNTSFGQNSGGVVMGVYNTLSQFLNKSNNQRVPPLHPSQTPPTQTLPKPDRSISTIVLQVPSTILRCLQVILQMTWIQTTHIYSYFNSSHYSRLHNQQYSQQQQQQRQRYQQNASVQLTTPDFILPLVMHRERVNFLVRKRPHVDYFLQQTAQWYDLVIYTASLELYGSAVIDMLEKDANVHFKGRYYRQDCIQEGVQSYTKDLRVVNEDLSSSFIIDNSPNAFRYFPDNAIHIHAFVGQAEDDHLLRLLPMLDCLRFCSDVRNILSRRNPK